MFNDLLFSVCLVRQFSTLYLNGLDGTKTLHLSTVAYPAFIIASQLCPMRQWDIKALCWTRKYSLCYNMNWPDVAFFLLL